MAAPAHDLRLPDALRRRLARPFGPVVATDGLAGAIAGRPVAAVGDVVSLTLKELGIRPRLLAVDFRTQRGGEEPGYRDALEGWADRDVHVTNPAAMVTQQAWQAVAAAFAHPEGTSTCIIVDGEEDLLGLPVFAEAPLGSLVLYGMPGEGVVVAAVDEAVKEQVGEIVAGMLPAG